jgi:hypothetical protein
MVSDVEALLARVAGEHRFHPTRSQDGTLNYGWCAGGDSWGTKHISEHEAHVAAAQAAALREAFDISRKHLCDHDWSRRGSDDDQWSQCFLCGEIVDNWDVLADAIGGDQ